MKVESYEVKDPLELCERLEKLTAGTETIVLITSRLYEAIREVSDGQYQTYKDRDGSALSNSMNGCEVLGHHIYTVQLALKHVTAWISIVEYDSKEFEGKVDDNVFIYDLK